MNMYDTYRFKISNMKITFTKLGHRGHIHLLMPLLAIVVVAGVGYATLNYSHAAAPANWKGVLEEGGASSGYCLTAAGTTKTSKVVLSPCSAGNSSQSWSLYNVSTATVMGETGVQEFYLENGAGSNQCLNNPYGSKSNGTAMQIYTCNAMDKNALWVWGVKFTGKGLSAHQLINVASISGTAGKCLDDAYGTLAANTKVQTWTCKTRGQTNQNWFEANAPSGGGSSGSGTYSVVGNSIKNASGQQVIVHGVDRPSMEWGCNGQAAGGASGPIPASDFTTMKSKWNANAVRVPLNQDFWLSGAAKYCSSYQSNVATLVKNAEAAGLIVILDLHWSDKGSLSNGNPGQQCMADQNSVTFWKQLAAVYKSDPKVWFELYNEPHDVTWAQWLNGGSACGYTTVGMQQLYNAVRGAGANNIVVAGGKDWASNLNGVPKINGNNIAYAIHFYRQSAANSFNEAGIDSQFGGTYNSAPVISTEFGDMVCDGQPFVQSLLTYFHQHNVGYTAWAWYVNGCSFTSIITDTAGDCAGTYTGCVIQKDMKAFGASPS